MRFIDAHSGEDVVIGKVYGASAPLPAAGYPGHPGFRIITLYSSLMKPSVTAQDLSTGDVFTMPLEHRFMHPSFLFQHVAFLPS